jgi:hypothetical protein
MSWIDDEPKTTPIHPHILACVSGLTPALIEVFASHACAWPGYAPALSNLALVAREAAKTSDEVHTSGRRLNALHPPDARLSAAGYHCSPPGAAPAEDSPLTCERLKDDAQVAAILSRAHHSPSPIGINRKVKQSKHKTLQIISTSHVAHNASRAAFHTPLTRRALRADLWS